MTADEVRFLGVPKSIDFITKRENLQVVSDKLSVSTVHVQIHYNRIFTAKCLWGRSGPCLKQACTSGTHIERHAPALIICFENTETTSTKNKIKER